MFATRHFLPMSVFVLTLINADVFAVDYYRWQDANGITHYGATPPVGVAAEVVSTYNTKGQAAPSASEEPTNQASLAEQKALRKQECMEEEKRLNALKSGGARIRMTQPDGSSKYLSVDEIQAEITKSQAYLKEACSSN